MTDNVRAERELINLGYDPETAEISMTDESQGFAASGLTTVLCKAGRQPTKDDLTPAQAELLERYKEEFTPLRKQQGDTNSLSSVKSDAGEEQTMTKGNEMSDQNTVEQEAINKARDAKIAKLEKALMQKEIEKYNFDNSEAVASSLVELGDDKAQEIIKAFETIEKTAEVTISKSKETPLDKAFEEAGEDGEAEVEVEKSMAEIMKAKFEDKAKSQETK